MTETKEDFWGCVLSKESKEFTWTAGEEGEDDINHKLQITQACLGAKAKENERNLVQVTTENDAGKKISFCILSLRFNQLEQCPLDIGLTTKSTFKLLEGNGPVHLTGCHLQALGFDSMDSEDSDMDAAMDDSATLQQKQPAVAKKPSATTKVSQKPVSAEESDDDDEDDEDYEEDDSDGKEGLLDDEASEDDEDDTDEDDDEDEDEEDEDDDDEDDEDDEEEEVQPPSKKKKLPNGQAAGKQPKSDASPKKSAKVVNGKSTPKAAGEEKTPVSQKKDKQGAKTPSAGPKGIDEVKKSLLKSPNLPKSLDKFKNFMRSAHRVTDDKDVKNVWEWLQKSKK